MDTTTKGVSPSQYIIQYPKELIGSIGSTLKDLGVKQDQLEKALSSDTRTVASLAAEQVEALRTLPGVQIFVNRKVSVPKPIVEERDVVLHPSAIEAKLRVGVPTHGADKLHARGIKGSGVTVAVIDTGVAPHSDVKDRIKKFYDVFDKREEAPNDGQGHGTHVAGIAGAAGGVTGMAPEVDFVGIKVLNDRGSGTLASVMAGIDKAMEYYKNGHDPMVINMSLGAGPTPVANDPLVAKVEEARAMGIQFVIAAGNSGPRSGTVGTPGTAPSAVTVAAMDTKGTVTQDDDSIARFSSVGDEDDPRNGQRGKPDIAANGVNVLSLRGTKGYTRLSGTSMAAPMVAGGMALLVDLANREAAAGRLAVDVNDIDYAQLLFDSANDNPNVPHIKEGAGNMRLDLAAELLVERYGVKEARGVIADSQHIKKLENGKWVVDHAESIKANQLHAAQLRETANSMDKWKASKGKSAPRRFIAFIQDIVEAPVLHVAALKDVVDATTYDSKAE